MKRLLIMLAAIMLAAPEMEAAPNTVGKAVFEKNCSVCHSVNPPPKSAPPIVPIASRYHQQFPSRAAVVNHMAAFLKSPSKAASRVDPEAITRFGLMSPMALGDAERKAVAEWVWDQYNPGTGRGTGAGRGQGARGGNCK